MTVHSDLASTAHSPGLERRDAFIWRFIVTGFCFLTFGVGALIIGAVVLPIVRLAPASRYTRRARARAVMRGGLRLYVGLMHRLGGMSYEFRGVGRLGRAGQLVVANHPSLIDVLFLLAFTRGANCVVKQGLWRSPLTRGAVKLAEYITNDPTVAMIKASAEALRDGQTLIMFPEGTRTTPHRAPVFHRGAATVALRAARVVTPVYIRCEPATLTKAEPWYRIPLRRPRFTLIVGDDLPLDRYRGQPLPRASRQLNDDLHAHYKDRLGCGL